MKKNVPSANRRQGIRRFASGDGAFSLVEVVLSLGITSFALLAIVALLPLGVQSTKDSLEETGAVNVLSAVIADRQATPFILPSKIYQLPPLINSPPTNSFLVDDGNRLTANLNVARYKVDYMVIPPSVNQLTPYQIHLRVSWPAAAKVNPSGSLEVVASYPLP
jgi:type II secretory pathway pseudopilin PulG